MNDTSDILDIKKLHNTMKRVQQFFLQWLYYIIDRSILPYIASVWKKTVEETTDYRMKDGLRSTFPDMLNVGQHDLLQNNLHKMSVSENHCVY